MGLETDDVLLFELIDLASTKTNLATEVQMLIAKAVAEVLVDLDGPQYAQSALDALTQRFFEDAASRICVARCLERVYAGSLQDEQLVVKGFRFLLRPALFLTNSSSPETIELRDVLLAAGMSLIERYGEEFADVLFGALEDFEDSGPGAAAGESWRVGGGGGGSPRGSGRAFWCAVLLSCSELL